MIFARKDAEVTDEKNHDDNNPDWGLGVGGNPEMTNLN